MAQPRGWPGIRILWAVAVDNLLIPKHDAVLATHRSDDVTTLVMDMVEGLDGRVRQCSPHGRTVRGCRGGQKMTRMTRASIVATLLTVPVLVERAYAHHGAGLYDPRKNVELEGRLTQLAFVNPHSYVYFDVVGNDGKVIAMKCEMRSATFRGTSNATTALKTNASASHAYQRIAGPAVSGGCRSIAHCSTAG